MKMICLKCNELMLVKREDLSFDYAGTHCTGGLAGTEVIHGDLICNACGGPVVEEEHSPKFCLCCDIEVTAYRAVETDGKWLCPECGESDLKNPQGLKHELFEALKPGGGK